jgi:UDP-2,4-diacetamido-2,4,6-trideoxy-beta-L-altropyranose hydrolase
MRIAFRADASFEIGTGHLVRCLTLADELRARGAEVSFVLRDPDSFAARSISERGFRAHVLPGPAADGAQDAEQTLCVLRQEKDSRDWMVMDHYGLGAQWESRIREAASRVLAIDDLADRRHDCDVLLDQNFRPDAGTVYRERLAPRARLLAGPRYALLRPEYRSEARRERERDGTVRRVLISYGGADPGNETMKALAAIAGLARPAGVQIDVAVGQAYPHRAALRPALERMRNVTLHEGLPHLADVMGAADLALGAGGTTTWERLCLGLPCLITTTAENQVPVTRSLAQAGYVSYLGPASAVTVESLKNAIASRIDDPAALKSESLRGRALVDGAGAARVADEIMSSQGAGARTAHGAGA